MPTTSHSVHQKKSQTFKSSISVSAWTLALISVSGPNFAFAQTAPEAPKPPQVRPQVSPATQSPPTQTSPNEPTTTSAPTAVTDNAPSTTAAGATVTVTGERNTNRIDRQSYDLRSDVTAQTGNAGDALNRVPSVNVDSEGNISLRGNSNVNVLINGRASALMRGENRAAAILAMSGGDIESVEVMNNPGAQFSSEGSSGIINLVMRRNRRPGKFLSITAMAGEDDRYNFSTTASYTKDKISLSGGLSYRQDGRVFKNITSSDRKNAAPGSVVHTDQSARVGGRREGYSGNFGIDYNLSQHQTIGAQLNFGHRTFGSHTSRHYLGYDANNLFISDYVFLSDSDNPRNDFGLAFNWEYKGDNFVDTLKADLRYSNSQGDSVFYDNFDYVLPTIRVVNENRVNSSNTTNWVASFDVIKALGDNLLTTGAQVTIDDNQFDNVTMNIPTNGAPIIIANRTNSFEYYQIVSAGYATYQWYLGEKWIGQIGLRVENTDINTLNPANGLSSSSNYTNANPSAFLTYNISDTSKIRASYSHRLQRPNPQDLNPTIVYNDAENFTIGNPNLRPQETDAFELGYERSGGGKSLQIRGFYRQNENVITSFSRYLPNNIIETSRINGNQSNSSGIEFNVSDKFFDKLNVSLNSTFSRVEIDKIGLNAGTISGNTVSGRLSLDYTITPKDRLQLMVGTQGRQYTPQGYSTAMGMSNITYSRQLAPFAFLVVNYNEPFAISKNRSITDSNTIYSVSQRSVESRVLYVGFRLMLGTRPSGARGQPANPFQGPGPSGPHGPPGGMRPPGM
ncbi:MAG: tonb-dependent receptor [Hyphomonadaceae bacterium]|nr:MAG: tonb-dependent receptor [Hyphomonadaceae bacterium]